MKKFPKIVFSDFDGTLTEQGNFSPVFFDVLKIIQDKGAELAIVTGRPLSWAHFLLTHFPINCVITEGGGVVSEKNEIDFEDQFLVDKSELDHLKNVEINLINGFPGIKLSEDSRCRVTDRAIDLTFLAQFGHEEEIEKFLLFNKINFSRSNVHLNFWSGKVSKKNAIEYYLNKKNILAENCMYIGDSLNDESAFSAFDHCVGVSNINPIIHKFRFPPKIILQGKENEEILGVLNYLKSI